jgi:thymidylate synthase (FAD)
MSTELGMPQPRPASRGENPCGAMGPEWYSESGSTYRFSRPLGKLDPNILLADVAFNKHIYNDGHHVSPYNEGRIDVGLDNLEVRLVQGIDEDAFARTLSRAQKATIGMPADGDEDVSDWEEMLKGGLQTALETQTVIFEVYGVARATTHQLVRSRRAAFHQQSMRASYFGDTPNFRMPESVWRNEKVREAWEVAIDAAHRAYAFACEEDVSYQDARYILPIGTETYIMCEYPVREFLAVYAYRACSMFQWEICHTVRQMGDILKDAYPWLAPYIKISCENAKKCTFQGWEDVEKGCDFPWAKWEDRVYKPEAHRIRTTSLGVPQEKKS